MATRSTRSARLLFVLLGIFGVGGAHAQTAPLYAKGVNPADNLTRANASYGWADEGDLNVLTGSYEHRVSPEWGVRVAFSPFAHFDGDYGTGDFAIGGRYVEHEGDWHLGASLVVAGSTGDFSAFGKNRLRAVPGFLVVRPWSAEDFTAFSADWVEFIGANRNGWRVAIEQGHLFPDGWFVVGAAEYANGDSAFDNYGISLEAGRQLDERWQVAIAPGYLFSPADLSLFARASYFF